jgi:tRNA modification GTPase
MIETIYALASAPGRAGIAVYRLSGPEAGTALAALTGAALPPPRQAVRTVVRDPETGEAIDDGLVIWFPGPNSFTGEDVVELSLHGGAAIRQRLYDILGGMDGLRLAAPGEFTRRAVLAGKLDLTEAEGLIDLIDAETEAQRRQALRQAQGELGALYESWRAALVPALAHLEAAIDFPDEDLPEDLEAKTRPAIDTLIAALETHLADNRRGERLRDGIRIAILGPPNAGKSSLLNRIARRDAAIVSATAGTTRDVIETHLDLGGFPVVLADTAGIRAAETEIEADGVRRAFDRAETADLKIVVLAADEPAPDAQISALIDGDALLVVNKADIAAAAVESLIERFSGQCGAAVSVSAKTGGGIDDLLTRLIDAVGTRMAAGDAPSITRQRHRQAVADCLDALQRAVDQADAELCAEDLRIALRRLGSITGTVDVEALLDVIFRDFCIGK